MSIIRNKVTCKEETINEIIAFFVNIQIFDLKNKVSLYSIKFKKNVKEIIVYSLY